MPKDKKPLKELIKEASKEYKKKTEKKGKGLKQTIEEEMWKQQARNKKMKSTSLGKKYLDGSNDSARQKLSKVTQDTLDHALHKRIIKRKKKTLSAEGRKERIKYIKKHKGLKGKEAAAHAKKLNRGAKKILESSKEQIKKLEGGKSSEEAVKASVRRNIKKKAKKIGLKIIKGGLKFAGPAGALYDTLDQPAAAAQDLPKKEKYKKEKYNRTIRKMQGKRW